MHELPTKPLPIFPPTGYIAVGKTHKRSSSRAGIIILVIIVVTIPVAIFASGGMSPQERAESNHKVEEMFAEQKIE